MILRFSKMHGLGNDFVVINTIHKQVYLSPDQIRYLANRRLGVGCDQVLMVESPRSESADFGYRIFNADGQEVEQCGNGARCFARYVRDHGLTDATDIKVETVSGFIVLHVNEDGCVRVNMGAPRLLPTEIPFDAEDIATSYDLHIGDKRHEISVVSMGNPHAVLIVENIQTASVDLVGPQIEFHSRFPERVNVGFMEIVNRGNIRLRVYERGAGETLACGSGACAAVVAGRLRGLLDSEVTVELPGGSLIVHWDGDHHPVSMTGPATQVFEGTIEL